MFARMLARTMGRTLDELGDTMTAAEFSDHWDDWLYAPWGDMRADIHAALICKTVAEYAGKMRKEEVKLTEFLLDFDREEDSKKEVDPKEFFKQFLG